MHTRKAEIWGMYTLKIEHAIRDFQTWRAAFDRDPIGRQRAGVRRYRVCRPPDDPNYVMIDLDFDQLTQAQAFLQALQQVWSRPDLSPGLSREGAAAPAPPRARVVGQVDSKEY
jgi:hypothetical protein